MAVDMWSSRGMADRIALIAKYAEGADVVERALEGLSDADLDRRPSPKDWTAREVVHHLADAEVRSAIACASCSPRTTR